MEQFSLDEYLKNPTRPIVTRDGRSVRIVCTDREATQWPIVALVKDKNEENIYSYSPDGVCSPVVDDDDLFFAPGPKTKKVGWINLYKDADGDPSSGDLYETEEEALANRSTGLTYLGTSKVEWEE